MRYVPVDACTTTSTALSCLTNTVSRQRKHSLPYWPSTAKSQYRLQKKSYSMAGLPDTTCSTHRRHQLCQLSELPNAHEPQPPR